MKKSGLVVVALILLASCGPTNASSANENDASSPPPAFRDLGHGMYAMVFAADAPRGDVEAAAREHCAGLQWCKVIGWSDPAFEASAMPMTDREVSAVKLNYTLNRATGLDEMQWN